MLYSSGRELLVANDLLGDVYGIYSHSSKEFLAGGDDYTRAIWCYGIGQAIHRVGTVDLVAAGGISGGGGDIAQAAVGVAEEDGVGDGRARFHGQADFDEGFAGNTYDRHVANAQGLHGAFHLAVDERRGEVRERLM